MVSRRTAILGGLCVCMPPFSTLIAHAQASLTPPSDKAFEMGILLSVDPELRPAARLALEKTALYESADDGMLPQIRQMYDAAAAKPATDVAFTKHTISGASGEPCVVLYVINPRVGSRRGGILHTHGGGYMVGSAAGSIRDLQEIAAALDCAIVTVEYRLAPETHWQGSLEDAYAGLRWMHAHADEIGVDPAHIGVMGDSAGGGLAALVAIAARDRGQVPLAFQMLVYPMLDDRTGTSRPVPSPIGMINWTAKLNQRGWKAFLGQEPGSHSVPGAAVPARAASLAGLPPTFIAVGSIDLFVQENMEYARRLIEAAVPTQLIVVPGAFHGFDNAPRTTSIARGFHAAKMDALRRMITAKSNATSGAE